MALASCGDSGQSSAVHLGSQKQALTSEAITTLTVFPSASVVGQRVRLSTHVATSVGTPTGTVTFKLGSQTLSLVSLDSSGDASFETSSLPVGLDVLTATYSGDTHFLGSASASATLKVDRASTAVSLDEGPNPALHGQKVTFTARVIAVEPGAGTPTGTVTVLDGETALGTAPLSGGTATLELTTLSVGIHAVTASYGGDDGFAGATSPSISATVNPSCQIASSIYAAATPSPTNPCRFCDPSTNTTDWTSRASGHACPADALSCTADVCDAAGTCTHNVAEGCLIGNACIAANAPSPTAECTQCNPALSTTAYTAKAKGVLCADDASALTGDHCDGAGRCAHPLKSQCIIDGKTLAGGDPNPANSCQACDPLADIGNWTHRASGFPCADDGLSCTWDACDGAGTCAHRLTTGCLIGGSCVQSPSADPSNDCQECSPALATDAYSPKAHGVACAEDGKPNTVDVCDGSSACVHPLRGQCTIGGKSFDEGTLNPENPCQSCDPASTAAAWTHRGDGTPCASDDLSCTRDVCDGAGACRHTLFTGCLIGGTCLGAGAVDPANECRACNPADSTTSYVAKARGVACVDDSLASTLDVCDGTGACVHPLKGQCFIAGRAYDTGTSNPENPCQSCDPAASTTDWANHLSGFPCTSDGLSCTEDACDGAGACQHALFTGCLVAGACVGKGSLDPTNDCRTCGPWASTTSYRSRTAGTSCGADELSTTLDVCDSAGLCVHPLTAQCTLDGVVYEAGATNPANPCQSCDPASSASAWTNRVADFPCTSDGLACTDDVCDAAGACLHQLRTGCLIGGACIADGVSDPANACNACDSSDSARAYTQRPRGVACADDAAANTLDVCDGAGACIHPLRGQCTIAGKDYDSGTANPLNRCQACDATASAAAWTNRPARFPCSSDALACTTDACDGAGLCQHDLASGCIIAGVCVAAGALDPASDCRECDPARSRSAYSVKHGSAQCADSCTLDADCGSGTYCAADQVCRPLLAAQATCSADAQCSSGHCQSGVCVQYELTGGCGCSSAAGSTPVALLLAAAALALAGRRRRAPIRVRTRR
jgi:MYXO-CTERM domain-containing protein